jgi:xylose isomerase
VNIRHCINAGFLGRQGDRFFQYQPERSLEEKLGMVSKISGLDGVELKYPGDFEDVAETKALLERFGLTLAVVNINLKGPIKWRYGSLTSVRPEIRADAVRDLKIALDIAAELDAELVTCCPVADGYDYPFEMEYTAAWEHFVDGIRQAALHRPDTRLSLEYQASDPVVRILLRDAGRALYTCLATEQNNVGVTLDIGHSFAAGETPAEAVALLAREDRLFYIHTDDNTRDGDWDLLSGTVNFWHFLETLYYLQRVGYKGWLSADIFARRIDPVEGFTTNLMLLKRMIAFIEQLDQKELEAMMQREGNACGVFEYLTRFLPTE